ncbi:MAG TPA: response regulator transcription factor [Tepidiformaceae bacterium]|nr:response regulator transcription factor [Tepidiformaceae bacterium]
MNNNLIDNLTAREREVLELLSSGMSNAEIAETMFVSVHTVKTHIRHILEKLELDSRHQAADAWKNRSSAQSRAGELNTLPRPEVRARLLWRWRGPGVGWATAATALAGLAFVIATAWVWRSTGIDGGEVTMQNTQNGMPDASDGTKGEEQGLPPAAEKAPNFYSPRTLDRLDLQRALEDPSPFVRPLIEDGVLTPDEYVAAAVASRTCTEQGTRAIEGVVVTEVTGTPGKLSFGFSAPAGAPLDAAGKVYEACHFEYFRDVQSLWNSAEAQARFAPHREKLAACMREAGATVPESPDNLDLFDASKAFAGDDSLRQLCALASY